jgi:hypothetical protein
MNYVGDRVERVVAVASDEQVVVLAGLFAL